jgi:AraC-like DNA-binding protein
MQMTDATAPLHYTQFNTIDYSPEKRLDAWREAIGVLFEVRPAEPEAPHTPVVLDSWRLGPAVLIASSGPGFSYDRSSRAIARDGQDLFMVQLYIAGRCCVTRGAPEAVSEPGSLMVTDLSRPITTHETTYRNINVLVPRSSLAPLLRAPDSHGGRVLRSDLPLVALCGAHLHELLRQAPLLSEAQATDAMRATAQLLAAALNGSTDAETGSGVRVALTCQIRRYIERNLHRHDLTPETIAQSFGCSRATLYRLFGEEGGVRRLIQQRRLARAQLDLMSPEKRHMTIAEIGAEACYAHAQDFIRAYRREFGGSPGEAREQARSLGRQRLCRPAPHLPLWARWVRRIGP